MPKTPDWVEETPRVKYYLTAMVDDDHSDQEVGVTLEEFEWLKRRLACRRGLLSISAAEAIEIVVRDEHGELANSRCGYGITHDEDGQQPAAGHLETARDFYRSFPDLVTLVSEDFDRESTRFPRMA